MLESRGGKITAGHSDAIVSILDNYASLHYMENISKTVGSTFCRLVCKGTTKCDQCVSYRDSLQKSYHHWNNLQQVSSNHRTA